MAHEQCVRRFQGPCPAGLVVLLCVVAGCGRANRTQSASGEPAVAAVDAGLTVPSARAAASASISLDAASAPAATGPCTPRPEGGILIPDSARATHIRIAAAGSRALVTFWDTRKGSEGPDVDRALGYLFDASTASVGAKLELQKNDVGDEPVSAAVPVALSGGLFAISCAWAAPAGRYACMRARGEGGERPTSLFAFAGIANGGPERPDIAAVVQGEDALIAVPVGHDLQLFSARVSAKKKDSPFTAHDGDGDGPTTAADAFAATLSAPDEATIAYRQGGAIKARRAGIDQKWRGTAVDLSARGALVGAPAVASDGGRVVALFSQRAKPSDPWKVILAELSASGDVKRSELATGPEEAQGPGITKAAGPGCFHVAWVEGSGKTTRTKVARACGGTIAASSVSALSTGGVEGGRAYLATDPADATALFAVWQEIPAGKAAELRVAKLTCR